MNEKVKIAALLIAEHKNTSASLLQRKMRLSYSQAKETIDELERMGAIGPQNGAAQRTIDENKIKEVCGMK